jgi:hypothetical protein
VVAPFVIRACAGREAFVEYLLKRLPQAVVVRDTTRNAMETFRAALAAVGDGPAVHMEDDVVLTRRFAEKVRAGIGHGARVVQFFSIRKSDLTLGTRMEPGRTFLMGQCFYLPAGMSAEILDFSRDWRGLAKHPTGLDTMVGDFLKTRKLKYVLSVPSLVQHRNCKSAIDPRRSSSRQSPTFENPDVD